MTIEVEQVQAHLDEVLQSDIFTKNEKLAAFLRFIVEERLAGREHFVKQYTIAVRALGYEKDFDPQANPVVRIYASRLRRTLDTYYAGIGETALRILLPKGSYIPIFPPFEEQPSFFIKLPANPTVDSEQEQPTELSIVVLPFTYLSSAEDDSYLSAGITQELIVGLTEFEYLTVIGPLPQQQTELNLQELGKTYRVRFALRGTIRQIENGIRISVTLSDTIRGKKLWADTFQYDLDSETLFDIERGISDQVVGVIADGFGAMARSLYGEARRKDLRSVTAMDAILRYHYHYIVGTRQSLVEAIQALELALDKEPNNAQVLATLADAYFADGVTDRGIVENAMEKSRKLVDLALTIQPNCQMAHVTMASHYQYQQDYQAAYVEIEKAIELNANNAFMIALCGVLMVLMDNWDGLDLIGRAMKLNPAHPAYFHEMFCYHYVHIGDYEMALIETDKLNLPDFIWQPMLRASIYGHLGRLDDAKAAVDDIYRRKPQANKDLTVLAHNIAPTTEVAIKMIEGLAKVGLVELAAISSS